MYILIALMYWPIWLAGIATGHPVLGIICGAAFVYFGCVVTWRIQWKEWVFWP